MNNTIRLGYACINTELKEYGIFTSRSLILSTFEKKGITYIKDLASKNVDDLFKILIYNEAHGIRFFRISSCVFPHLGNPRLGEGYDIDFLKDKLKIVGKYAKEHQHRLTMHPGQFVQLGSNNEEVVKQSIIDLINHVKFLQYMGYTPEDGSVLIVHGGGTYGNKKGTLERWKGNFFKLPDDVQKYIVLENDEFNYGILDLLPICEDLQIPFCLDIFHNKVSKDRIPLTKSLLGRIIQTWKKQGMIPKIHVSEQQPGLRRGAHSKTLDKIPIYLFKIPFIFKTPLDIMLEVKDKEVSVLKMYYKYFDIRMESSGRIHYSVKKIILQKVQPIDIILS